MLPNALQSLRIRTPDLPAASDAEAFQLHQSALEWCLTDPIVIRDESDIASKPNWRERLQPFVHQVQNLITYCRRLPVSIIADDVGLGKTISAGLILSELIERRRVNRCLVVCTKLIGPQWVDELRQKFDIDAAFASGADLISLLASDTTVVVTTYESARRHLSRVSGFGFDMLILDEAHKLRNLYGNRNPPKVATVVRDILQKRIFRFVLMLTATPMQNRIWDLYSLIDLLVAAKGHENPFGTPEQFQNRFARSFHDIGWSQTPSGKNFRDILRQYLVRTRRGSVNLTFPQRQLQLRSIPAKEGDRQLLNCLRDAMESDPTINALLFTSLGIALMSSPQAFQRQLANVTSSRPSLQPILNRVTALVERDGCPSKMLEVLTICEHLRRERPDSWRVVIFTSRIATLELLSQHLEQRGYSVGVIRGSNHEVNRRTVAAYSCDPPEAHVIVSTDSGAEGLNLQAGNVLINYDLPWNPMVIEQRIGRVQRLGSRYQNVVIFNLAVKDSPEDLIVARLLHKLVEISESIGDIESILEAAGERSRSRRSMEEEIGELVRQSLMGINVEQQRTLAEQSIEHAKRFLTENAEVLNQTMGDLSDLHRMGIQPPELTRTSPSATVKDFMTLALRRSGYVVATTDSADVLRIESADGRLSFLAVQDRQLWKSLRRQSPDQQVELLQPGQTFFERVLETWRRTAAALIVDTRDRTETLATRISTKWLQQISGSELQRVRIHDRKRHFRGHLRTQITASNGLDRYEKLIDHEYSEKSHSPILASSLPDKTLLPDRTVVLPDSLVSQQMQQAVRDDKDTVEFCQFYETRLTEELPRAGGAAMLEKKLKDDFTVSTQAELVSTNGVAYESCNVTLYFSVNGKGDFQQTLRLIPAGIQILDEPEVWERCQKTSDEFPSDMIGTCDYSRMRVLNTLLQESEVSGRKLLAEHLEFCPVTGKQAAPDEFGASDLSGTRVILSALFPSALSGGRYLRTELRKCQFSNDEVLQTELLQSDLSGRFFRIDLAATCSISRKTAHHSELQTCSVSGQTVQPQLLATCPETLAVLLPEHLVTCAETGMEVSPAATVRCSVTNELVIRSRTGVSAVSGAVACLRYLRECEITKALVLTTEHLQSELSKKWFRCDEAVASTAKQMVCHYSEAIRCEFTEQWIYPTDAVKSEYSGRIFSVAEQKSSSVSGRIAHASEISTCPITSDRLLPDETAVCGVSGLRVSPTALCVCEFTKSPVLPEYLVTSSFSGKQAVLMGLAQSAFSGRLLLLSEITMSDVSPLYGHESELTICAATGDRLFPNELVKCSVSDSQCSPRALIQSEVSGRLALPEYISTCAFTGLKALNSELSVSDYSQQLFLSSEHAVSDVSGRRGHRSELMQCSRSEQLLFEDEGDYCSLRRRDGELHFFSRAYLKKCCVTQRLYEDRILQQSDFSELYCLPREMRYSTFSRRRYCPEEGATSAYSGKQGHLSEFIKCEHSGDLIGKAESVKCSETGRLVSPSYVSRIRPGKIVLSHLTGLCEFTGHEALKRDLNLSEVSGRSYRNEEQLTCCVSGKTGHQSEFMKCAVSEKAALPGFLEPCELTGRRALPNEMLTSEFSGKRHLRTNSRKSDVSGRIGHTTEFRRCVRSGKQVLLDEGGYCSFSNGRFLLQEFLGTCCVDRNEYEITRLKQSDFSELHCMTRLARKSEISGRWYCPPEEAVSEYSRRRGHLSEFTLCEYSNLFLAYDELVECTVSAKTIARTKAVEVADGVFALEQYVAKCDFTGKLALAAELLRSDISGRRYLPEQNVTCHATGKNGHESELGRCEVTQNFFQHELLAESSVSGLTATKERLVTCEITGRLALPDETEICEPSQQRVLRSLLIQSDASGKWVLKTLAKTCEFSGANALASEGVECRQTGLWILHDYAERCSVTNEIYAPGICHYSAVSGKPVHPRAARKHAVNNKPLHPDEAAYCQWTGGYLHASETQHCQRTGLRFARNLLRRDRTFLFFAELMERQRSGHNLASKLPQLIPLAPNVLRRTETLIGFRSKQNPRVYYCRALVHSVLRIDLYEIGFVVAFARDRIKIVSPFTRQFPDGSWKVFQ